MKKETLYLPKRVPRDSNIEFLRIVFMLMIVAHHCIVHSNAAPPTERLSLALWFLLTAAGKIGVDGFVLITGYFLADKTYQRPQSIARFYLQVLFYAIAFLILTGASPNTALHTKLFFPIAGHSWWFASAYFFLMLMAPFISRALVTLSNRSFLGLLLVLFAFIILLPTFQPSFEKNHINVLVFCYCLGAYIRLSPQPSELSDTSARFVAVRQLFFRKLLPGLLLIILGVIGILYMPKFEVMVYSITKLNLNLSSQLGQQTYPISIACAVGMFLFFKNLPIKPSKIINTIASATFGVYLFHEQAYAKVLLWDQFFPIEAHLYSTLSMVLHILSATLIIYAAGTAVDLLRQYLFEKPLFKAYYCLRRRMDSHNPRSSAS
ncbi:MAG: acyltransferase [Oscillospiraceae bacterium]|jgi:surface polysaccharide O-acyltransferase-like enzyme|nr:acyltransferase [Oscillospiraceae bacterium]